MTKKQPLLLLIPVLYVAVSSLLLFTNLDAKAADLFQRLLSVLSLLPVMFMQTVSASWKKWGWTPLYLTLVL